MCAIVTHARLLPAGLTGSIDQSVFQNATLQQEYDQTLANAAGVPVNQVNSSFNSASNVQVGTVSAWVPLEPVPQLASQGGTAGLLAGPLCCISVD